MNTYFCPVCCAPFPLLFGPSLWIRRGFLRRPDLRCPHCGAACRPKVAWRRAAWAWPLGALATILLVCVVRREIYPEMLRAGLANACRLLVGGLGGLMAGLAWRTGFELEALAADEPHYRVSTFTGMGIWLTLTAVLLISWIFSALLGRRMAVFSSAAICILVYSLFYLFSSKRLRKGK